MIVNQKVEYTCGRSVRAEAGFFRSTRKTKMINYINNNYLRYHCLNQPRQKQPLTRALCNLSHPSTVHGGLSMSDEPDPERLKALEKRIDAVKRARAPKPPVEEHFSAASQGWRMVIELVSGLGIGFGIGYGLDRLFGTLPWFLVLFTLMGFAAGVKTMLRTATEISKDNAAAGIGHPIRDDEDEEN